MTGTQARYRTLAIVDGVVALLFLVALWGALPIRWWPVDVGVTALALGFAGSAVALFRGVPWAVQLARGVALVTMAVGMVVVLALAWTVASLAGLYGPVGGGGAIILAVAAALLVPYLVLLPAWQLSVLAPGRPRRAASEPPEAKADAPEANADAPEAKAHVAG